MSGDQLAIELARGGRFVVFPYVFSILILTFRRNSEIHFFRKGQDRIAPGLPYTLLSLCVGWWGFPWGFIYTPVAIFENLSGGKDVTDRVLASLRTGR